jgi:hypothetical protein
VAGLDHPNIVPVLDVGKTDKGLPFVVSKFIEGSNLASAIRERRFSYSESARLVVALAEALQYAHQKKIVHRDLKPANILLDESGNPYLTDFGLALREEDFGKRRGIAGSPAYMSPEQASGEGHLVDGRSDIFSLGAVFYELLTGRSPFAVNKNLDILVQIATVDARPPRQLDVNIPNELERICLKALARRPTERYTTARDLADDLRSFLNAEINGSNSLAQDTNRPGSVSKIDGPKAGNDQKSRYNRRRIRTLLPILVIVALALLVALVSGWKSINSHNPSGQASTSAPLAVRAFKVEHFADRGDTVEPRGELGVQSFAARYGDHVRITAELSQPAFYYLVALNPDGGVQLCWPAAEQTPPERSDRLDYPAMGKAFDLTDEKRGGLQAFVVIASPQPLPAFAQWRRNVPDLHWRRLQTPAGVVWRGDAERLEAVLGGTRERGTVSDLPSIAPLSEIIRAARAGPGVGAVAVCAFAVEPAP